ncbi:MAG: hypothetical protein NUV69_00300 [Candidatus Curtissbacteria bacterium]|nr:hypothetical protein [Candidatus Curtissbacteria bacterium]
MKQSGQILILVLLVVVVALSVGLSVASRNITNLRTSTQTEQSQRAFAAAEGGVEHVLANLSDPSITTPGLQVPVGDLTAKVDVKASSVYESVIEEGTVGQVNLTGYSGPVTVEWIKRSDESESGGTDTPKASLELIFVCDNPTCFGSAGSGSASQQRFAYQAEPKTGQSGFTNCDNTSTEFLCKNPGTIQVEASDDVRILRLRPFWRKATVKVTGGNSFPIQTYEVVSTATTELGLTRKVRATRTALPQLPAALDYVLFSESDIVK